VGESRDTPDTERVSEKKGGGRRGRGAEEQRSRGAEEEGRREN